MDNTEHRHRTTAGRIHVYSWLGAGALTVGVGAALAAGSGIAQADSTGAGNPSVSAAADGTSQRTQGPRRVNAKPAGNQATRVESQPKPSGNATPLAAALAAGLPAASLDSSSRSTRLSPISHGKAAAVRGRAFTRPAAEGVEASAVEPAGTLSTRAVAAAPKPAAAQTAATASNTALREASAASTITEKDTIDIGFTGLNSSIGWIPGVGTAINGVKFAIDAVSLASSLFTLNFTQAVTELGNLVADTIGLVPVVGAPITSLLYQSVLGVNVKLGIVVQESMQSYLDSDSTFSKYLLHVDAVDVPVSLGGTHASTATVSKPDYAGVGIPVDVTNTGLESGWSIPLEGRLKLAALIFA